MTVIVKIFGRLHLHLMKRKIPNCMSRPKQVSAIFKIELVPFMCARHTSFLLRKLSLGRVLIILATKLPFA